MEDSQQDLLLVEVVEAMTDLIDQAIFQPKKGMNSEVETEMVTLLKASTVVPTIRSKKKDLSDREST